MVGPIFNLRPRFSGRSKTPATQHNPQPLLGRDIFVYRNLHRNTWSLQAQDGPERGRIIGYADRLELKNARFVVREGGRQRVLKEGRKNVHAGIRGRVTAVNAQAGRRFDRQDAVPVSYNPFRGPYFIDTRNGTPLASAERILMDIHPANGKAVLAQRTEPVSPVQMDKAG